jgi:hypothetical protein
MLNQVKDWVFINRPSRPPLSKEESKYWKSNLKKLLKVGIELEMNLQEPEGTCRMDNYHCPCTATFSPEKPMPNTNSCFQQCVKWCGGKCEIAKNHGCAGTDCLAFASPCPACNKYDRGCAGCSNRYKANGDPQNIRASLKQKFKPTNFVGQYGDHGIYKICKDGSLLGGKGVEVATVGIRVSFWHIYNMMKKIMDACEAKGAYVNERCSIHIHLLTSYLRPDFAGDSGPEFVKKEITELERPIPEIIIANFHQLVRRYHCALIWLSIAGNSLDHLTRWEKFRKPVLHHSAARTKMPIVVSQIIQNLGSEKNKYAMMNYEQMLFDGSGNYAKRLHVEARYLDGNFSPAAVAAHSCLIYGLMLKAAEISRFGVLQSGNKEYMQLQKEIYKHLCNGSGSWQGPRTADTSCLDPYVPALIEQSRQLVRVVNNTLVEHEPAGRILASLCGRPLAYRIVEGKSWADIEKELIPAGKEKSNEDVIKTLDKIVHLNALTDCGTRAEWTNAAVNLLAEEMGVTNDKDSIRTITKDVDAYLENKLKSNDLCWSNEAKSFIAR